MNSDAVKSSAVSPKGSPMQTLALKGAARRWSAKLHRWSGLALLAVLLIAGITGAIMAFRWEIDRAINPQLFTVKAQSQRLPLQTLTDSVERRFPDAIATTVVLPKASADAAMVYIKSRREAHVAHVEVDGVPVHQQHDGGQAEEHGEAERRRRTAARVDGGDDLGGQLGEAAARHRDGALGDPLAGE